MNLLHSVRGAKNNFCALEESIAQSIMMQTTCRYGEVEGRPDYGSAIWELEFNQLIRTHEWEEQVSNSLQASIQKHEKRLKNVDVSVHLSEVHTESKNHVQVRKKAEIYVKGTIVFSEVPFHFNTILYISPITQ